MPKEHFQPGLDGSEGVGNPQKNLLFNTAASILKNPTKIRPVYLHFNINKLQAINYVLGKTLALPSFNSDLDSAYL